MRRATGEPIGQGVVASGRQGIFSTSFTTPSFTTRWHMAV